jgi:hypothetical protein
MPGSAAGVGELPAANPSAGDSPPRPGRYPTATATSSPATASGASGHHIGTDPNPSTPGRSANTHCCRSSVSFRKPKAAAAIGTPSTTASTSSRT